MGLFKKLRSDEKKTATSPKTTASGPTRKAPSSSDSSGDTSEFSSATSQSSHSSQDTKRQSDPIPRKLPAPPPNAQPHLARHSLQPRVSPGHHLPPYNQLYLQHQQHSSYQHQPQALPQQQPPSQDAHGFSTAMPRGRASMPPQTASSVPASPAGANRPARVSHSASTSMSSTVPMPMYPATADESYTSGSVSADTSAESSEGEEPRHPYYDQWKQYYAAMAGYQGGRNANMPPAQPNYLPPMSNSSSRRASFAGYQATGHTGSYSSLSNSHSHSSLANFNGPGALTNTINSPGYGAGAGQNAPSGYMQYYHAHETRKESGLVRNSRMSTLKSNRSSSAPSLAHGMDPRAPKQRAISVNVAAGEVRDTEGTSESEEEDAGEGESQPVAANSPVRPSLAPVSKSVSYGLSALAQQEQASTGSAPVRPPAANRGVQSFASKENSEELSSSEPPSAISREDSAISDYGKYLFNTTSDSVDQDVPEESNEVDHSLDLLDPGVRAALSAPDEEPPHSGHHRDSPAVSRADSSASKSSYNSLQSESNFSVGRRPSRIATQTEQQRRLSRRSGAERKYSKSKGFVPPMPGPPPPIYAGQPRMPPSPSSLAGPPMMMPYAASTDNIPPEGAAFQLQQMQQQIQQLQQLQQQQLHMSMYQGNPRNSRISLSPQPQQHSSDPLINAKIEEFVKLRQTIAAGHKTFDFRLKWAKMLITAVNYKLYAYINIKGDGIPGEQAPMNRLTFIKSAVTHLQKMLKELDVDKHTPQDRRIFAEVCYIHGCLLMHDYTIKYEQDFNIQQDKDEADRFFRKCLELNPLFFRAHYKLAELFEEDQTEESFDIALYHYTQAAKLGYNRAIYQIALIYLTVPNARSLKYFKYLKSLSDIDMDSKDIKLGPEDRAELEEISGLASFQLAKIYEGIYPGDLGPDDDFVQKSLEFAPVNYAKSLSYYNRAARLHCLQAQVRLGHIYENGDLNRKHNPNKSVSWFIKAATSPLKFKRHPEAMLGLSRWFIIGTNGQNKHIPYPDPQGALMWADRACKEFNFPEAYFAMGQFAEQGLAQGDPQEWYNRAYELGFAEAATKLPG